MGRPALGLAGGFAYAQVKLDPDRVFAVHVDVLCADPAHPSRSESAAGYRVGRRAVRITASNLYKKDRGRKDASDKAGSKASPSADASPSSTTGTLAGGAAVNVSHDPARRGWFCLRFDLRALLRLGQKNGCLLYTSPSPRDQRGSRMPSSA